MSYEIQIAEKNDRRWREHSADFTPPEVVEQFMRAFGLPRRIIELVRSTGKPAKVLCPCAGAGVYAMVLRAMLEYELKGEASDYVHITAIELRQEETQYLTAWCDDIYIGDAIEELEYIAGERKSFDVVIDNPAFPIIHELLSACSSVLNHGGIIAFLMATQSLQSAESHDVLLRLMREHAVTTLSTYQCSGRVKYRVGRNTRTGSLYTSDLREYCHRVFVRDRKRAFGQMTLYNERQVLGYKTFQLAPLPKEAREWSKRPGTQDSYKLFSLEGERD